MVKLQILNLSVKLYLTNPQQTELLCQYVFNLARYDENYDIRDRARFLKPFIFPLDGKDTVLSRNARKIFLAAKPAPLLESKYHGREQYQLGSLSHYLNIRATGYHDLPPFPTEAPDTSVRDVQLAEWDKNKIVVTDSFEGIPSSISIEGTSNRDDSKSHLESRSKYTSKKSSAKSTSKVASEPKDDMIVEGISSSAERAAAKTSSKHTSKKSKSFYSDSDKSTSEFSSSNDSSNSGSGGDSDDDENESSIEEKSDDDDVEEDGEDGNESYRDCSSDSNEHYSDDDDSSTTDPDDVATTRKPTTQLNSIDQKNNALTSASAPTKTVRSNLDLLLDLDDIAPVGPIMTPSFGGFLSPSPIVTTASISNRFELVGPSYIPLAKHELLNKINGHGLQIYYRFTRAPHLYSAKMVSIELTLKNESNNDMESIHISDKSALTAGGIQLNEFAPIAKLSAGQSAQNILGVDFNDSTQSISFDINSNAGTAHVSLRAHVGELIRSVQIGEMVFKEEQARLRGMNEHSTMITVPDAIALTTIRGKIFDVANVAIVNPMAPSPDTNIQILYFAGQTMASQSIVLIAIAYSVNDKQVTVTVNCEKMVVGSMLLNDIKLALKNLIE